MPNSKPLMTSSSGTNPVDASVQSALRTLDAEADGIAAITAALQGDLGEAFARATDLIRNARGRLIVTGLGKSGHIGRKIAATFASTGTPAFFVHAAEAGHGDLGMITTDDVILALSWSGEQPEMKNLVNYSARFAIPMIAVTSNAQSSLGAAARIVLELPKVREACPHNLAPTTSTLMQAAIGDALAIALLESRGFTALEFANFHPGGKLGAINVRGGGSYSYDRIDTSRTIAFPGLTDSTHANFHGSVGQLFGEVGYGFAMGTVALEPFAGLAYVHVQDGSFQESGGLAALSASSAHENLGYSTLGLRAATFIPLSNGTALVPRGSLQWQHASYSARIS